MGSLVEELRRREAAACGARAEADRQRSRIEELAEELARADEQVYRLVVAGRKSRGCWKSLPRSPPDDVWTAPRRSGR